jgi:hypothetical protein
MSERRLPLRLCARLRSRIRSLRSPNLKNPNQRRRKRTRRLIHLVGDRREDLRAGRLDVDRPDVEHRVDRLDAVHREVEYRVGRHRLQGVAERWDQVMVGVLLFRWRQHQEGAVPQVLVGDVAEGLVEDQLRRQK